ncbi:ComF family protein [Halopseudomonas pachastrellae]|uniref:ComF family protein n=1 Tax=Halopseudomonas pachastrellae TaxID=254161 RepID=UPI003D7D1733
MKNTQVYKWIKNNLLQPCLLCLSATEAQHDGICHACLTDLPWQQGCCERCALPLPHSSSLCGRCLKSPPAFCRAVVPMLYRFPLDALIPAFKYHRHNRYGWLLAQLLAEHLQQQLAEPEALIPDLLLPVPMHPRRQAQRGYNQAFELARDLAKTLELPCRADLLQRVRQTTAQEGLDAAARRRNLRGAFTCPKPEQLEGQHLALIDDVMTTGATLNEASRTLLAAGAASVQVWCVARTP